mgnify:FL=1
MLWFPDLRMRILSSPVSASFFLFVYMSFRWDFAVKDYDFSSDMRSDHM